MDTTTEPGTENPAVTHAPIIAEYALHHGLSTVVETGTGYGFTAERLAHYDHIQRIITCEIDPARYFGSILTTLTQPKIYCVFADSKDFIPAACFRLPASVWFLDAHDTEWETRESQQDSPLLKEIWTICSRVEAEGDVILIDDARLLGVAPGWPTLENCIRMAGPHYFTEVVDDMVRMVPK